jgi:hypothetical protein
MINKNKTYKTRDGREVRIYATDGAMPRPVHGAVKSSYDSTWHSFQWHEDGRLVHNVLAVDLSDLIEDRPRHKRTVWVTVYPMNRYYISDENIQCDIYPPKRIACIKVELDFEEGQGL